MKIKKYPVKIAVAAVFLSSFAFAQNAETAIIKDYLNFGQADKSLKDVTFKILDHQNDKALGGEVVNINQTYNNLPIYGAISSVLIKNNKVSHISNNLLVVNSDKNKGIALRPSYDVKANFEKILSDNGLKPDIGKYTFYTKKHNTVLSELAYFQKEDQTLQLVQVLNFYEDGTNNYWNIIVDAQDGKTISKSNLTVFCNFSDTAYSHDHAAYTDLQSSKKEDFPLSTPTKVQNGKSAESASYRVFALPIEAPSFGGRTLERNPWQDDASPLGWHNDGETAYTTTQGNNTYTYADETGYNVESAIADGGANRNFDFPFDDSNAISTYKNASITNLFYMNNKMHDIFYRFGFDEAGRNFQSNNFGKGDIYTDLDPVLAEARDGGGVNNANFSTPPDGYAPRMQMYIWQVRNFLNYNSPADLIPRKPNTGTNSDFGKPLSSTPITGEVVLATPLDACTNLTNTNLTGKIALIQRGTCPFDKKFKNAQDNGATAVIIYNADPLQAVTEMIGSGTSSTISGVLVDNAEGKVIKEKIDADISVNVSLQNKVQLLDGSMDNGIIAHEYTHGITGRSTGNGYSCLNYFYANEQMGEGWSDFYSLMVTNPADASADKPRGVGTYVIKQSTTGLGIRPAKYSPDFRVNNYTYGDTNGMAFDNGDGTYTLDVHSIGFVWATMLWDLHWKFADKYGFSNDIANNKNSGSAKVMQLVTSALKIQGCYPSFVKGRDAIIAADAAINNGENKCMIWESFAKRGLGVNAKPGLTAANASQVLIAISDQVEDYSVPSDCLLATQDSDFSDGGFSIYPNPAKNEFHIRSANDSGSKKVSVAIYDMLGRNVLEELTDTSEAVNISGLGNGNYVVKGTGIGVSFNKKLIIKK